jgi:multidrug efflux system membrane fusion protein
MRKPRLIKARSRWSTTRSIRHNQIDQATGTARLKATFPNADNQLWPGEFLNARVLVATEHNALTIPSKAVQRGPDGVFTYVVKANATVEARRLQIGAESGALTVVTQGLNDGETVVTSNQYRLQPGTSVRTAADAATPTRSAAAGNKAPAAPGGVAQ